MRLPVRETIATGTANVYEVTAETVIGDSRASNVGFMYQELGVLFR